jgi:hypothetical protein
MATCEHVETKRNPDGTFAMAKCDLIVAAKSKAEVAGKITSRYLCPSHQELYAPQKTTVPRTGEKVGA